MPEQGKEKGNCDLETIVSKVEPWSENNEPDAALSSSRYIMGRLLGEGGMAEVFEANDRKLERVVALKRLKSDQDKESFQRFCEEAFILASLDHPGALPIYDSGFLPDGAPFYSMKKVRGQTLRDMFEMRKSADVRSPAVMAQFIDIFESVCQTVAFAHQKGIVHRDLKPENVMVDGFGAVYVMDWGIAKRLARSNNDVDSFRTQAGIVLGSPAYMAPEQAGGLTHQASFSTDVFSLGVMLYELLSGTRPFEGKTATETIEDVLYHRPSSPRKINPEVPKELAAICKRAMEKDPRERYETAKELAEDLRCFREDRPVLAAPPSLFVRMCKLAKRHKTATAVITSVLFFALIALASYAHFRWRENQLISAAFRSLESAREDVRRVDEEIAKDRARFQAEGLAEEDIGKRLENLYSLRNVRQRRVNMVLAAIIGRQITYPDPRVLEEGRKDTFTTVDEYFLGRRFKEAEYLLEDTLQRVAEANVLQFSQDDVSRLKMLKKQARKLAKDNS